MSATKTKRKASFGLSEQDIKVLRQRLSEKHPAFSTNPEHKTSPHNAGMYGWSIEALFELGANKRHSMDVFIGQLREVSSRKHTVKPVLDAKGKETGQTRSGWQRFINKGVSLRAEDEANAKDRDGKILQNLQVLQRMNDYGLALLQYGQKVLKTRGAVIEITTGGKDDKEVFVALNTNSNVPLNQLRRTRKEKPKAKPKAKAKTARKSKPKTKAETKAVPATDTDTSITLPVKTADEVADTLA